MPRFGRTYWKMQDLSDRSMDGLRSSLPSWQLGHRFTIDRKSTRLNSSHLGISYAVFCLKKKKKRRCSSPSRLQPPHPAAVLLPPGAAGHARRAARGVMVVDAPGGAVSLFLFFFK